MLSCVFIYYFVLITIAPIMFFILSLLIITYIFLVTVVKQYRFQYLQLFFINFVCTFLPFTWADGQHWSKQVPKFMFCRQRCKKRLPNLPYFTSNPFLPISRGIGGGKNLLCKQRKDYHRRIHARPFRPFMLINRSFYSSK